MDKPQFEKLPYWAVAAFITRCAKRFLPLYVNDDAEPESSRIAVKQAIELAEQRIEKGGKAEHLDEAVTIGNQHFDHYDIDALNSTLSGIAQAADVTFSEVGDLVKHILYLTLLAKSSLEAAYSQEVSGGATSVIANLGESAAKWAVSINDNAVQEIRNDFETLVENAENWDSESPVPLSVFGEFWPNGFPDDWPPQQIHFKPRARIVRTIGDRLISGPEAAVIELIKNSHDADASWVRVSIVPSSVSSSGGHIIVEDDGHGMSFDDIVQRWMEPATTNKRDRKKSPKQRILLGSKGIGRFASARLGRFLELISTSFIVEDSDELTTTRIPQLDWSLFDESRYLEEVSFPIEKLKPSQTTGTVLRIHDLRDEWPAFRLKALHRELRQLISPLQKKDNGQFDIYLDLSQLTKDSVGFDGDEIVKESQQALDAENVGQKKPWLVRPFPVLDASDYAVDGAFDSDGTFDGEMIIRRGDQVPQRVQLKVPLNLDLGEEPCGIAFVKLHIFDREAVAIRTTATEAGFGGIGVREARKILDEVCGVSIYRDNFRVRPYGDGQNDWLTLDAKRVQNPTIKIGRNQIAGTVLIESEVNSNLIERSSREGLEDNGSFIRLRNLVATLLAEVVEPSRRKFRISAGLEKRNETNFKEVFRRVQMGWAKILVAKIPEPEREEAEALIESESNKLATYLKKLEKRQAQLEAKVTMGLIVGEVMHQGNTPLSFLETETERLMRWYPSLFSNNQEAIENREEVPRLLNGMSASNDKLRALFNALSPLSGARRGRPKEFSATKIVEDTLFLFKSRMDLHGVACEFDKGEKVLAFGYPDDLATTVTNLVDNAVFWLVHHQIDSPNIKVHIVVRENSCLVTVADNGNGIPDEFTEQLFDVGFTLKPNGTGLGLSIALEAMLRSKGELRLLMSDVGAIFEASMPIRAIEATTKDVLDPEEAEE